MRPCQPAYGAAWADAEIRPPCCPYRSPEACEVTYGMASQHSPPGVQPGDCSNAGHCNGRTPEGDWPSPQEGFSEALAGLHAWTSYQDRQARTQGRTHGQGQRRGQALHGQAAPDAQAVAHG